MSIRDFQMFIGFANFYKSFIQGFNKIVTLLSFLLKITGSSDLVLKALKANNNKIVANSNRKANKTVMNLSKNFIYIL